MVIFYWALNCKLTPAAKKFNNSLATASSLLENWKFGWNGACQLDTKVAQKDYIT